MVLYLVVRKRLERKEGGVQPRPLRAAGRGRGADLGGVRPVRARDARSALFPILIVVGLILAGGVYFAKMMIFNREVLDTEPGVPEAF